VADRILRFTDPRMEGEDVLAAQSLLHGPNAFHTRFLPHPPTGKYGQGSVAATREAKFHAGYPLAECTSEFGGAIAAILRGERRLTVAQRRRRAGRRTKRFVDVLRAKLAHEPTLNPGDSAQAQYLAMLRWGITRKALIHYSQDGSERVAALTRWDHLAPLSTDCSGSVKAAARAIGLADWDHTGYAEVGYTGTILDHCAQLGSQGEARAGDFAVFGPGTGCHVVSLLENGSAPNPLCFSHGQESGPSAYPLSVEIAAFHGEPIRWRRNPVNGG
jgi:hypothetical protein